MESLELVKNAMLELWYPRLCNLCQGRLNSVEQLICRSCLITLPRARFAACYENMMDKQLWGRTDVSGCLAFLLFRPGSLSRKLLHAVKYRDMPEIGYYFGHHFATEQQKLFIELGINLIAPVPLHPRKQISRGYNQSERIASGIADVLGVPMETDMLVRKEERQTQTKYGRFKRWENVSGIYEVREQEHYYGRKVLLVDDVFTTGATVIACADALKKVKGLEVSVATLAMASK